MTTNEKKICEAVEAKFNYHFSTLYFTKSKVEFNCIGHTTLQSFWNHFLCSQQRAKHKGTQTMIRKFRKPTSTFSCDVYVSGNRSARKKTKKDSLSSDLPLADEHQLSCPWQWRCKVNAYRRARYQVVWGRGEFQVQQSLPHKGSLTWATSSYSESGGLVSSTALIVGWWRSLSCGRSRLEPNRVQTIFKHT